ncbi:MULTISPECIES: hypoxanthine phosphoribosyltransferase [Anaerolinea]|uniref:Hypoxanthine phosphoribosyltransferase n=1 Tax=Anaerolinea thermophila (strain DSM 14523 / JCM 11388 / NBRC 100420 / UNI-1) TaxID=926569 RepID=E8N5Y8_ANATU|nr:MULTISPECIES: hypoxanthine phosphoribosyltransferase [Anaerolinea]BAJ63852.1 hypoxanthine phosphoribosyltransferase [Anaerolinea thermophila UNI-1]
MERDFWLDDVQEVLFTEEQIHERVKELARQISQDYQEKTPIIVGVLKGVMCFLPDLIRKMSIPVEVDFIAVSSYSTETRDKGVVRVVKDLDLPLMDRHVLFVEDVVDTGLTLHYLLRNLRARNPASLEVCTLLNKNPRRLINIPIRYVGFEVPDYFVVGYGLDYNERYRNLPYIGILKPSVLFGKD